VTLIALPGLAAWWTGRRLLALRDDPALAERFFERRQRLLFITLFALVLLSLLSGSHARWAIPLALFVLLAGLFPSRKALFGETWGFAGYLVHVIRFWLAAAGFWLLLWLAPFLLMETGALQWPLALTLGAVLLLSEHFYPALFRRVAGVAPLDRPDLDARFAPILARSRCPAPRLYRLARAGGRWANALAQPSFHAPGVIFGQTLLAELEPEEVTAILAHEVAHLEHYDRRRLLRLSALNWLLIVLAVAGVPLAAQTFPLHSTAIGGGWTFMLLAFLALHSAGRRAHEADSDRRAVALCGDADALGRALAKVHALSQLPRRWSAEAERSATHPSLARRIQAIRAEAGLPSIELGSPIVVRVLTPGCFVILEAERASWLDGVPAGTPAEPAILREHAAAVQSLRYSELTELRVRAAAAGAAALVAKGRAGFARTVPLDAADVASVQAALDLVDVKLGPEATGRLQSPAIPSLVSSAAVLVAIYAVGLSTVLVPGLIAAIRPTSMALVALGITALGEAVLILFRFGEPPTSADFALRQVASGRLGWTAVGGLAVLGALALSLGWARARGAPDERRAGAILVTAPLAALALLAWAGLGWSAGLGSSLRWLHEGARAMPSATLAPLGLGAALLASGHRRWLWAGRALILAALVPLLLGSGWVGGRLGHDLLSATQPALRLSEATATLLRQTRVEMPATALRLSPSGRRFAVRQAFYVEDEDGEVDVSPPATYRVGAFGEPAVNLEAEDLAFLDDGRALALVRGDGGWRLELHELSSPPRAAWRLALPEVRLARLGVEPASGAWTVSGFEARSSEIVAFSGVIGREGFEASRWKRPGGDTRVGTVRGWQLLAYAPSARTAVVLTNEHRTWLLPWSFLLPFPHAWREVWALGPGGADLLAASPATIVCPRVSTSEPVGICVTFGRGAIGFWAVDSDPGGVQVLGTVKGLVGAFGAGPGGRLAGWTDDRTLLLIDPTSRTATRLTLPRDMGRPTGLYPLRGLLGTLAYGRAKEATVAVWEIR